MTNFKAEKREGGWAVIDENGKEWGTGLFGSRDKARAWIKEAQETEAADTATQEALEAPDMEAVAIALGDTVEAAEGPVTTRDMARAQKDAYADRVLSRGPEAREGEKATYLYPDAAKSNFDFMAAHANTEQARAFWQAKAAAL